MRTLRLILPGLALALLTGTGCFLISGQFMIPFDFGPVTFTSTAPVNSVYVDLNTVSQYNDHKDKLQKLTDLALLGKFINNGGAAIKVELWMTSGDTGPLDVATVRSTGTRVWGPFDLAGGESKIIGWDESAALFDDAGRVALVGEIKGDGEFSLYALATTGTFDVSVRDGFLVLVVDAG